MISLIGYIFILVLYLSGQEKSHENPVTLFNVTESISAEVYACIDTLGLLEHFRARIYTPICEGTTCYPVELDVYWDLMGRFLDFDTIAGKKMTKLDHIPFTDSDYDRLKEILGNANSLLSSYATDELVAETRRSAIDGITGATVNEIRESVIEGAVYSCHTLWHLVNGAVNDSIQNVTRAFFTKDLVLKIVNLEDQELNYFLINSFSEEDYRLYLPEVLQAIQNGKGYFPKNAIEKLPSEIICSMLAQEFFAERFHQLDYFAQVALLEKLRAGKLSKNLKNVLREYSVERNSYRNELIKSLLTDISFQ